MKAEDVADRISDNPYNDNAAQWIQEYADSQTARQREVDRAAMKFASDSYKKAIADLREEITARKRTYEVDQEEIEYLKKENERLREALKFYADYHNWENTNKLDEFVNDYETIKRDNGHLGLRGGRRARAALEGQDG